MSIKIKISDTDTFFNRPLISYISTSISRFMLKYFTIFIHVHIFFKTDFWRENHIFLPISRSQKLSQAANENKIDARCRMSKRFAKEM